MKKAGLVALVLATICYLGITDLFKQNKEENSPSSYNIFDEMIERKVNGKTVQEKVRLDALTSECFEGRYPGEYWLGVIDKWEKDKENTGCINALGMKVYVDSYFDRSVDSSSFNWKYLSSVPNAQKEYDMYMKIIDGILKKRGQKGIQFFPPHDY